MLRIILALALLIPGCKGESTPATAAAQAGPAQIKASGASATPPLAKNRPPAKPGPGQVLLDGELLKVRWDDGDTFSWKGATKKIRARLADYNTLESYAPVHRWGDWTYDELYANAKRATEVVRKGGWVCRRTGKGGGYGRIGVQCRGAARALISAGLAHAFAVGGPADPELVALQQGAIEAKKGMWAKGAPQGVVTSLHSADEPGADKPGQPYDRVASTSTGEAAPNSHDQTYVPCQEVCRQGSCMRHIPYPRRFGKNRVRCPIKAANPSASTPAPPVRP